MPEPMLVCRDHLRMIQVRRDAIESLEELIADVKRRMEDEP